MKLIIDFYKGLWNGWDTRYGARIGLIAGLAFSVFLCIDFCQSLYPAISTYSAYLAVFSLTILCTATALITTALAALLGKTINNIIMFIWTMWYIRYGKY